MDKKTKRVSYCGTLTTQQGKVYFLLHPAPVTKESWQRDEQQMFYVVPTRSIGDETVENDIIPIFSYPRHIVTTNPTIEYQYIKDTLLVWDLGEYSVEKATVNELEANAKLEYDKSNHEVQPLMSDEDEAYWHYTLGE